MKKTKLILTAAITLFSIMLYANESVNLSIIETNATILHFDSDIKYVDFGSSNIKGSRLSSSKMLKIQCVQAGFSETTMSVVTADGGYHQFALKYAAKPETYVWQQSGSSYSLDSIGFSKTKTTHFICDEKVVDIVCGSNTIIADYADKIENIIKAKALYDDFPQTNIHLITESGYIYTFNVKPDATPDRLSVVLSSEEEVTQSSQAIFKSNSINENQMREFARKLVQAKPAVNDIGVVSLKMAFAMSGIYSYNDLLAFRFDISNMGKIEYSIDFIKGYIRDKSETKTTAVQEQELFPVYVYYSKDRDPLTLKSKESESIVIFYSRFTIPNKRVLNFEMFEKNGGRHLSFPVSSKEILKAKAIY